MRHYAEAAGLSGDEIDTIIGLYNDMNGRLSTETPNIAETIYAALTDGLADDETTVSGLKEQVEGWASDRMTEIEEGYEADILVLSDSHIPYPRALSPLERLERFAYLHGDINGLEAKWVRGRRLF